MAEYNGSAMAACWNAVSFPQMRTITVSERNARGMDDITHSVDATQQMIDKMATVNAITITCGGFASAGSDSMTAGSYLLPGTTGSLDLYPEGAPAAGGKLYQYCHNMRVASREVPIAVADVVPYTVTFENLASGSWTSNGVSASHA